MIKMRGYVDNSHMIFFVIMCQKKNGRKCSPFFKVIFFLHYRYEMRFQSLELDMPLVRINFSPQHKHLKIDELKGKYVFVYEEKNETMRMPWLLFSASGAMIFTQKRNENMSSSLIDENKNPCPIPSYVFYEKKANLLFI